MKKRYRKMQKKATAGSKSWDSSLVEVPLSVAGVVIRCRSFDLCLLPR